MKTGICPDCGGPMYRYATYCGACKSKGARNSRYGATVSDATKAKISAARTGKTYGPRKDDHLDGRGFARRWLSLPDLCERCREAAPRDRHHVDGNTRNNHPSNIAFLCRRCHQAIDGRLEILRANGRRQKRLAPSEGVG